MFVLTVHPLALVGVLVLGIAGGVFVLGMVLHRHGYAWFHDEHCCQCGSAFGYPLLIGPFVGSKAIFCDACFRKNAREAERDQQPCGDCGHAAAEHHSRGCFCLEPVELADGGTLSRLCPCQGFASDIRAAAAE